MGGNCWFQANDEVEASSLMRVGALVSGSYQEVREQDLSVLKAAIYSLGEQRSAEARAALMRIVQSNTDLEIRKAALYALQQGDFDKELVAFYVGIARDSDEPELQKAALYAVAEGPPDQVIDLLAEIALSEANLEVRKAAVYALQNVGNEQAQDALMKIFTATAGHLGDL
jgi:HEAT repeat protein